MKYGELVGIAFELNDTFLKYVARQILQIMELQYLGYVITTVLWIYTNRLKILEFSTNNKIGKWTVCVIILPIAFPIAVYKILYWEEHDPVFRRIMDKVRFQKKISDFV